MKYSLHSFLLAAFFMLFCQSLSAYDFKVDGICYKILSDTTAEVTYKSYNKDAYGASCYNGNDVHGAIVIPSTVTYSGKSYSVTGIGNGAFRSSNSGPTSIEIPNSVTYIGEYAFYNCLSLTDIYNPSGLYIGQYAFCSCAKLSNISNPIGGCGKNAFQSCHKLKKVYFEKGGIGEYAFSDCPELIFVNIPYGARTIGTCAFRGCNFTSIIIPNSVQSIGIGAFRNCSNLKKVIFEDGDNSIEFPSNGVDQAAFGAESPIDTIYVGRPLYGKYDTYCKEFDQMVVPELIFGKYVTNWGLLLNKISGISNLTVANSTFLSTLNKKTLWSRISDIKKLVLDCDIPDVLTEEERYLADFQGDEIVIGDSAKKIGKYAFYNMLNLKKITLGSNVNKIGSYAFTGCSNLSEMYCNSATPAVCASTAFDEDTKLFCDVFVPEGSLAQYQAANQWKEFRSIGSNPYIVQKHHLIYKLDGAVYQTLEMEEGAIITAIDAPTQEGYTFSGWTGFPTDMLMPDHDLIISGTFTKTISIGTTYSIADADVFSSGGTVVYDELTYFRTFSNTHWQALYVPFSIPVDSLRKYGLQVAELNDTHQWDFNGDGVADSTRVEFFTLTSGNTEANNPYLIRATEPTTLSLTLKDIEVQAAEENSIECSSTKQKFTFVGTYTGVSGADMYDNNYYGMSGGGLKRVSNNTVSLKPQRWYMKIENKNGSPVTYYAPSIRFIVDGIEDEAETSDLVLPTVDSDLSAPMYSIEGIRQTSTQLQPGLYLRQGKKIVIR
jgi:hypothetical protein